MPFGQSLPILVSSLLILASFPLRGGAEEGQVFPRPGDYFHVHQERIASGTLTQEGKDPLPFRQETALDFSLTVLESASSGGETRIRSLYDRVRLSFSVGGGSSTVLIEPNRVVLDGTPAFDGLANPDLPESILSHLLSENLEVILDRQGQVIHLLGEPSNRQRFSFLDLALPVLETLDFLPPRPPVPGESWTLNQTQAMLSGTLEVQATATYRFVDSATQSGGLCWICEGTGSFRLPKQQSLPNRLGQIAPLNLRSDLLGPDLFAPPPETQVLTLAGSTQTSLRFRPDWGFLSDSLRLSQVRFETLSPQVDSTQKTKRRVDLLTTTKVQVEKRDPPDLDKEAAYLWLGR